MLKNSYVSGNKLFTFIIISTFFLIILNWILSDFTQLVIYFSSVLLFGIIHGANDIYLIIRGNNKNKFYNYIELRKNGMVNEYLEYFPEFKSDFDEFRKSIETMTMKLFNNYKKAYIYKSMNKSEIPFELRPLCYEMHGIYLKDRLKWDRKHVINFFNRLDPARIMFVVNFEKNKEYHMEKNNIQTENTESAPVEELI